jgi:hypothetical protein
MIIFSATGHDYGTSQKTLCVTRKMLIHPDLACVRGTILLITTKGMNRGIPTIECFLGHALVSLTPARLDRGAFLSPLY